MSRLRAKKQIKSKENSINQPINQKKTQESRNKNQSRKLKNQESRIKIKNQESIKQKTIKIMVKNVDQDPFHSNYGPILQHLHPQLPQQEPP